MLKFLNELAYEIKEAMRPPKASEILPLMRSLATLPARDQDGVELCGADADFSPECFLGELMEDGSLALAGPFRFRYQDSAWVRNGLTAVCSTLYTHWITKAMLRSAAV